MEAEKVIPIQEEEAPALKAEIKEFYKKDVLAIIKKVVFEPVSGTYSLFVNRSEKSFNQSLILMASAAVVSMIFIILILPSEIRQYAPWFSMMAKAGFFTLIFLFLVSFISFLIKMVSGKPSFKNELLTGALCAVPFTGFVLLLFVFSKIMMNADMFSSIAFGGYSEIISKAGIFLVIIFYILLLFINILLQSLRASGTRDAIAWYLSPVGIFLALYFTIKIVLM